ncbi:hypothetical protein LAZ67_9003148 [Cordylochernes scorpioides]|uniref:Uncharacterized protein n=1 Tax=Cordylochernes scorpioides TaxID=51811 RepID=A0ABY6KY09_9ARAC|nr:hypothetical protein LAZ67_9003148 [Cordylochernes scorpioides]
MDLIPLYCPLLHILMALCHMLLCFPAHLVHTHHLNPAYNFSQPRNYGHLRLEPIEDLITKLLAEIPEPTKNFDFGKAINIALCDESASANASVLMETTPDVNILKKANKGEPFDFKSKSKLNSIELQKD